MPKVTKRLMRKLRLEARQSDPRARALHPRPGHHRTSCSQCIGSDLWDQQRKGQSYRQCSSTSSVPTALNKC